MGKYVAGEIVKKMIKKGKTVLGAKVLQLGITFKENCPDIRNSRAVDVIEGLKEFGCETIVLDPWANPDEVKKAYGIDSVKNFSDLKESNYDAVILAVPHREFRNFNRDELDLKDAVVYDIKGFLPREMTDGRL